MNIYGVVGWKNAGKTGLMERLVSEISGRGFSVSTLKHAHHAFDVDHPGKDSHRHRMAGATEVLLSSRKRWALMHENRGDVESDLQALLTKVSPVDLVLIEGYKRDLHPKIEAHRAETGNALIAPDDPTIRAVASDVALDGLDIPVFDLNDTVRVADFILREVGLTRDDTADAGLSTRPLRNDCFALPAGVDWVPVDVALETLKNNLTSVTGTRERVVDEALGRHLSAPVRAPRANPPAANSAVDGYGFAHAALGAGPQAMALVAGRSAAGAPFDGLVPRGQALRILTGALLPDGVDTVVLQEDVTVENGKVIFDGVVKPGSNCRKVGEDVAAGQEILAPGHKLCPQDIALLSAVGCQSVDVYRPLRVGVLSTGDEIIPPQAGAGADKTFDANRPMLLGLAATWGYAPVDLGHVADDRGLLAAKLEQAVGLADVILTSGGASAGEEDHVSALLGEAGALSTWRIAMKPGRPLALGQWQNVPVFGLPGNPVAALVCALIFARPALSVLAGGSWTLPQGFVVPADFEKRKKPGRREYLRARINAQGRAQVFQSEGSGRISGLSWADGLVELEDGERDIRRGDPVRYLPFSGFGI